MHNADRKLTGHTCAEVPSTLSISVFHAAVAARYVISDERQNHERILSEMNIEAFPGGKAPIGVNVECLLAIAADSLWRDMASRMSEDTARAFSLVNEALFLLHNRAAKNLTGRPASRNLTGKAAEVEKETEGDDGRDKTE